MQKKSSTSNGTKIISVALILRKIWAIKQFMNQKFGESDFFGN
jgi:hypothetical protein